MSASPWERAAQTPVTWVVVIAYLTMAMLTIPDEEMALLWFERGWLTPELVADGEPWRLLSHAFLHGGVLHLALNLYALVWIGPALELTLGSLRFALLYAVAAAGGGVCVALTNSPLQPVVGGSGALFGMFGAAVALHAHSGRHHLEFLETGRARQLLLLIAVNLVLGFLIPMVSNAGHVGGLVAGFVFTFAFLDVGRRPVPRRVRAALAAALLGLLVHTLLPVTRWDWLWHRAAAAGDAAHRAELERAALQSARDDEALGGLAALRARAGR